MEEHSSTNSLATYVFFAAVFVYFAGQIYPISDFWWHIATGRWIFENRQLPVEDVFSYVHINGGGIRENLILQGYWLIQSVYFIVYKMTGYYGLIVLKSLTFFTITLFVWRHIRKNNGDNPIYLIFLLPLLFFSFNFVELRPQVVTFLGVVVTYFCLESWRVFSAERNKKNINYLIPVPVIALLWANCHPGFVLATVLTGIYLLDAFVGNFFNNKTISNQRLAQISIVFLLTFIATLISPTSLSSYRLILGGVVFDKSIVSIVTEYKPTFMYFWDLGRYGVVYSICFVSLVYVVVFFCNFRSICLRHFILMAGFSVAGFLSYRYFYIFILVTTLICCSYLSKFNDLFEKVPHAISLILAFFVLLFGLIENHKVFAEGPLSGNPADRAINFAVINQLPAPVFHPYDWGGNILWLTGGRYQTFIDARALSLDAFQEYKEIKHGKKAVMFQKYGINTVMFYVNPPNGTPVPGLILSLLKDRNWDLVYFDDYSVVFCKKDTNANLPYLDKYLYTLRLINYLEAEIAKKNNEYVNILSAAQLYYNVGEIDKSLNHFKKAININPDDMFVLKWIEYIGSKNK